MKYISREKAALAFFAILIAFGLGAALFYISSVGHSLNVAATNIDDAAGNLGDYTAIVYKGLATKEADSEQDAAHETSTASELNKRAQSASEETPDDEKTASSALSNEAENEEEAIEVATVDGLRRSYVDKDASVFILDVENPHTYDKRSIIRAGKYTFGLLYLDEENATPAYLAKRLQEYKAAEVDFTVALVSDLAIFDDYDNNNGESQTGSSSTSENNDETSASANEAAEKSSSEETTSLQKNATGEDAQETELLVAEGLNIVISLKDEGLFSGGVIVDGVFYDDAALSDEVGTLLISPSRVISAKDVSSL